MLAQFNSLINLLSVFIQGDNRVSYSQALPFIQFVLFGWLQQGGELRAISFQQVLKNCIPFLFRVVLKKNKWFIRYGSNACWFHKCTLNSQLSWIFTARCYASAVLAMDLCPSVCVCVCLSVSVTSRCCTKTAKRIFAQTTRHDTAGTLVFWCQRSPRNSTGVTPYEGAECRWGGSKSATFDK